MSEGGGGVVATTEDGGAGGEVVPGAEGVQPAPEENASQKFFDVIKVMIICFNTYLFYNLILCTRIVKNLDLVD